MRYTSNDHVFALCAYGESPYLEDCVASLENQSISTRIIMCTATPNAHISSVAEAHGIPLFVNKGPHGIAEDWNFAYATAKGSLVTLAHQDDVYDSDYVKDVIERLNTAPDPLIAFTDYFELRNGIKEYSNKNLKVKKCALMPLRVRRFQRSRWIRRRVLSICDPICCPSVTYVKPNLPKVIFESHFKSDLDWQAWEMLSRFKGSFCYIHKPLMGHRIHEDSTTTQVIGESNGRSEEDLEMYLKFWPRPIARFLNRLYASGQDSNKL